jgi:beta-glucanase (GH16 family)
MRARPGRARRGRAAGSTGLRRRAGRILLLAALMLASGAAVLAATRGTGAVQPRPLGSHGSWRLIFDDEFGGGSLDRSRWSTGWFGSGITGGISKTDQQCFDPRQVAVAGGTLQITLIAKPQTCAGSTHPYASGIVTSNGKFSFSRGFIQVRAWLPPDASGKVADWPAIWVDSQNWPVGGELDVVEGLAGEACWHFHAASVAPGGCTAARGAYAGGWHTFGALWERRRVYYYYDGQRVGVIRKGVTTAPMYLVISLGTPASGAVTSPATLRVSYVRVWQR